MMRFTAVLPAVMLAMTLSIPPSALAGDTAQAGKLFKEGNKFRLAGKYKEALEKYNAAYKLLPSFKIEYNTALVLDKMGNHPAAYMTYKTFLKSGAGKSPEKILQKARKRVAELKQKIALVKVTSNVSGAIVKVNGINVGKTPLPGDWEMGVKAPKNVGVWVEVEGYQTFTRSMSLKPGQAITVEAVLKPVPKPAPAQPVAKLPEKAPEPKPVAVVEKPKEPATAVMGHDADGEIEYQQNQKRRSKTIWAWTTLGVGLACAAGAGVMYGVGSIQVSSAYDAYKAVPASAAHSTFNEKWSRVESASKLYIGGHVLAGVAAAAMGVSVYMFASRPTVEIEDDQAMAGSSWGKLGVLVDLKQVGLVFRGGF